MADDDMFLRSRRVTGRTATVRRPRAHLWGLPGGIKVDDEKINEGEGHAREGGEWWVTVEAERERERARTARVCDEVQDDER